MKRQTTKTSTKMEGLESRSYMTVDVTGAAGQVATVVQNGNTYQLSLVGPGEFRALRAGNTPQILDSITLTGTTAKSRFSVEKTAGNTGSGFLETKSLVAEGALGVLSAEVSVVNGTVTLGGVKLWEDTRLFGSTVNVGGLVRMPTIRLERVFDGNITLAGAAREFAVSDWVDTDNGVQTLTVPSVRLLESDGAFETSITMTGALVRADLAGFNKGVLRAGALGVLNAGSISDATIQLPGVRVGSIDVSGRIFNSTLTVGTLGRLEADKLERAVVRGDVLSRVEISGEIDRSTLRATSLIGSVSASRIVSSTVFAGVKDSVTNRPSVATDFSNPGARILKLSVSGDAANAFTASVVAGTRLGVIELGGINTANAGTRFGVVGDEIARVSGRTSSAASGTFSFSRLINPGDATRASDFSVTVV